MSSEDTSHRILVPIKRVPDYEVRLRVNESRNGVITDGVKWVINPFDEIALEQAIRIREGGLDAVVSVLSIGGDESTEQLRTAIAMGADEATLIANDGYVDSFVAAKLIAARAREVGAMLIIFGKQSIDSDSGQVGPMVATDLGWPLLCFASSVEVDSLDEGGSIRVVREVDGGLERCSARVPAVVTVDLRLNEPRYPTLPGIMKAKKKPIAIIEGSQYQLAIEPKTRVCSMRNPEERKTGVICSTAEELVDKLRNEAKVI